MCHNVAANRRHNSSLKRRTDWSGCPGFQLGDKYMPDRSYLLLKPYTQAMQVKHPLSGGLFICDTGLYCCRQCHQKRHVSRLHTIPANSALSRDYQPSSLNAFLVADHTLHSPLSHSPLSLLKQRETLLNRGCQHVKTIWSVIKTTPFSSPS